MSRIRTHYDNLKVARDAPIEVIKAAYPSLSQKYHPDRNPDDPNAGRVMLLPTGARRADCRPTG
ncbi:DnaJ domain-containing protein [Azoarcus sp. CIB]|uniref:DnaJ domain-containing protein n=1 Tax=Aromatoleum sp. (strain CIB) TaxID=198107 RepID=UPI0009FB86D9|nr:DnaJ domain-containing protein [Azoarcus sp. CIB]